MTSFSLPAEPEPRKPETSAEVEATLRERLRDEVAQIPMLPRLIAIVAEACQPDRIWKAQGKCDKCGCPHSREWVQPRYKAALDAMEFVLTQLEGRPGVANTEDAGVIVERIIVGLHD